MRRSCADPVSDAPTRFLRSNVNCQHKRARLRVVEKRHYIDAMLRLSHAETDSPVVFALSYESCLYPMVSSDLRDSEPRPCAPTNRATVFQESPRWLCFEGAHSCSYVGQTPTRIVWMT